MKTGHIDESLLHDLYDGSLSAEIEEDVRAHLASCPACRHEYEALSDLLDELRALPTEAQPARDLWPQIAWQIEDRGREARKAEEVRWVEAPARHAPSRRRRRPVGKGGRRFSFAAWQLMAASIAVALVSGSAVWAFLSRGTGVEVPGVGVTGPAGPVAGTRAQNVAWMDAFSGYDQALTDLETVVEQGRGVLDPETIRVLEDNLETIDRAIDQARTALSEDPGSTVLQRLLSENLRRKVDLLRHAALAVIANT